MTKFLGVVAALLMAFPQTIRSQVIALDSVSKRVAQDIRSGKNVEIGAILVREGRVSAAGKLEIVDTAVSVILAPSTTAVTQRTKARLISDLSLAAQSTASAAPIAINALRRIGLQSKNEDTGVRAAVAIAVSSDATAAVHVLVQLASFSDNRAAIAVDALNRPRFMDMGGPEALRRLWDSQSVSNVLACEAMQTFAYQLKWRSAPNSGCKQ